MSSINEGGEGIFALRGDLDGGINDEDLDFANKTQYIGLVVGDEEFLFPISNVSEIVMLPPVTFVPGSHKYIEGVINLRGTIIPAINIRKVMNLHRTPPSPATRIIVVKQEETQVGLLVDAITYVIALSVHEVENQAVHNKSFGADLISGISKRGEKINGIIDITKVLSSVDFSITNDEGSEEGEAAA